MSLLVVTGLKRESRILAGPGIEAIACGGRASLLEARIDELAARATAILSIGLGGGLDPRLRPGSWVVAAAVSHDCGLIETDRPWSARLERSLSGAFRGVIAGIDAPVASPAERAALAHATGALAADMESHVAARVAARRGLPFAAARVISDGAGRTLPAAALAGMKADGGMDLLAVLAALARDPRQLPALLLTAAEAGTAFRSLVDGRRLLGAALAAPRADLAELPLDVV